MLCVHGNQTLLWSRDRQLYQWAVQRGSDMSWKLEDCAEGARGARGNLYKCDVALNGGLGALGTLRCMWLWRSRLESLEP